MHLFIISLLIFEMRIERMTINPYPGDSPGDFFLGWWVHVTLSKVVGDPLTIGDEKVTASIILARCVFCSLFFFVGGVVYAWDSINGLSWLATTIFSEKFQKDILDGGSKDVWLLPLLGEIIQLIDMFQNGCPNHQLVLYNLPIYSNSNCIFFRDLCTGGFMFNVQMERGPTNPTRGQMHQREVTHVRHHQRSMGQL